MFTFPKKITLLVLLATIVSCASVPQDKLPEVSYLGKGVDSFKIAGDCLQNLPRKVAILPFENKTSRTDAKKLVRLGFYRHFSSKRYQDLELFEVDDVLAEYGLNSDSKYLKMPTDKLGELLDVDGLVYGKITGFNKTFLGLYSNVYAELEVSLVDAATGEVLWVVKHKSIHHEGQVPFELIGLFSAIFRTSIHITDKELLRTVDDLCRTVVAALPEPEPIQLASKPPHSHFSLIKR